ncbi:MATE family efflux transporter, partial [Helicobacter pullorum NCTC 12824]
GVIFALSFAAQGTGRMGWIFCAGAIRLVIAAGGGWLAVSAFGVTTTGLFAIVALALVVAAATCAAAAYFGGMWPTVKAQGATQRTQSAP